MLIQLIYEKPYGKDDTIGCYLDLDSMTIKWSKNGQDLGVAYEIPNKMRNLSYFPSVCMKNAETKFNFGNTPFSFQPAVSTFLASLFTETFIYMHLIRVACYLNRNNIFNLTWSI